MRSDSYTNKYLDLLDELKGEIDLKSDQPLDKLFNFVLEKALGSPVKTDLLFAIGLAKAPEGFFIEIWGRSRLVYLTLRLNEVKNYDFLAAEILGKNRIGERGAREALLSGVNNCKLRVPGVIEAAKRIIKTCKVRK